jgi:RNA polymerase sigma-70 factor (ECF subfamily)
VDRTDVMSDAARSMPAWSDGDLARLIAAGDEAAFMTAYDAHASLIYAVVARLLSDREAAAEIIQETYLTLWQRAAQYRTEAGSLRTWLMRIARNRALDRLRAEARRPRLVSAPDGVEADGGALASAEARSTDIDAEPGLGVERRWTQAVVRTAVATMPADEREVIVLAYDQGLSQSQIANRLALPVGTVKSRTRRGMHRLRETLGSVPDLVDHGSKGVRDGSR